MCLITRVYSTLATNQCNKVWLLLKVYIAFNHTSEYGKSGMNDVHKSTS